MRILKSVLLLCIVKADLCKCCCTQQQRSVMVQNKFKCVDVLTTKCVRYVGRAKQAANTTSHTSTADMVTTTSLASTADVVTTASMISTADMVATARMTSTSDIVATSSMTSRPTTDMVSTTSIDTPTDLVSTTEPVATTNLVVTTSLGTTNGPVTTNAIIITDSAATAVPTTATVTTIDPATTDVPDTTPVTSTVPSTITNIPERDIDEYLLAHYPFDGNVDDVSGNSRHGAIDGVNENNYTEGVAGTAMNFTGAHRVLVTSFENFVYGSEFSVSFWFNYDGATTSQKGLINNGFKNSGTWEVRTRSGYYQLTSSVSYPPAAYTELDFTPDQWHHVVMTYNGTKMFFFLDSAMQSGDDDCCTGPIGTSPNRVTIGQMGIGREDRYYIGLMDEVKLFNISLTVDEVLSLFTI